MVSEGELAELESAVRHALATGDLSGLDVIGFGEVTTVLRLESRGRSLACKRLLPFPSSEDADRARRAIDEYVRVLRGRGVDVVDTQLGMLATDDGPVLYAVQPALEPAQTGPGHFRAAGEDGARRGFERIVDLLRASVSPTAAPDGQLSNWAFVDDRLVYFDVSSPFLRDDDGNEVFDFEHVLRALPPGVRFLARRWALKSTLDTYFSLRGQAVDFLGNLNKERLGHLVPTLLPIANDRLSLSPPVTQGEVDRYYRNDARMYAWLQAAGRGYCWFRHEVRRKPYPYLPKPRIRRHSGS